MIAIIATLNIEDLFPTKKSVDRCTGALAQLWYSSMYDWEDWQNYYSDEEESYSKECRHEWIPVLLLNEYVWDCKHCGAHKEKVEGNK